LPVEAEQVDGKALKRSALAQHGQPPEILQAPDRGGRTPASSNKVR
jgi:hypothetical protein